MLYVEEVILSWKLCHRSLIFIDRAHNMVWLSIITALSVAVQQNRCHWHRNSAACGVSRQPLNVSGQQSEHVDPCGQSEADLLLSIVTSASASAVDILKATQQGAAPVWCR